MNIYDYARLSAKEKEELLIEQALFIENYKNGESTTCIYFLDGFFIEVTIKNGKITENIPFKRGYKIDQLKLQTIEKRNAVFDLAA